jgi:hypothetical protein
MGDVLHLFTNTSAQRCAACDQIFVAPVTIIWINGEQYHQFGCPPAVNDGRVSPDSDQTGTHNDGQADG